MKSRKHIAMVVSLMLALSVVLGGALPTMAQADERTFYESNFVATGTDADYYNEAMDLMLNNIVTFFTERGDMDKLAGYDEPLSFTTVGAYYSGLDEDVSKMEEWYGESWTTNRYSDLYKRLFNVDYTFNWQCVNDDYNTKLNLDIAAQELPDIFVVQDQAALMTLAQSGLIKDMTDVIENEAPSYLKDVVWGQDDGLALSIGTFEGRNYGLSNPVSSTDDMRYLWIRNDWLEKLNLEAPKTLDDLEAIMEAFVKQDPDGNGVDDTWGIFLSGNGIDNLMRSVFAAYGAYPIYWHEAEDGTIVYGATQEATKLALKRIASWYAKGYINPETISGETPANEDFVNEKVGVAYYPHWLISGSRLSLCQNKPDTDWQTFKLPSLNEGEDVTVMMTPNVTDRGFLVVNNNFEHPELALKLMTISAYTFLEDNNGIWWYGCFNSQGEGRQANCWMLNPVRLPESAMSNLTMFKNLIAFRDAGHDESVLHGQAIAQWSEMKKGNGDKSSIEYNWYAHSTGDPDDEGSCYTQLMEAVDSGHMIYDSFHGPRSGNQTFNDNWSAISDAKSQMYIRIVYNQEDPDAVFDEWLDTWKALGGEEITQYVNDYVAANN